MTPTPTPTSGAADLPEARPFTKKPVTIAAIQWTGKNLREVITFTDGPPYTRTTHAGMAWEAYTDLVARDGLKIYTLEGKMLASPGDWIIRGVKGEFYPCKNDIFEATYSPAALAAGQATAAQQGVAYAALPTSSHAGRVYEEGFLIGTCPLYTADKMRAFADATCALRASHGQAQAQTADSQLLQFYGVTTDAELIAAQAAHIEKLQAKLTKTPSFAPQRVREG